MKSILVLKHIAYESPGFIQEFLDAKDLDYAVLDLNKGMKLPPPETCRLAVSLGGPMSVNDDYAFLQRERIFLQECVRRGTTVLGVCLGAQMLASALGARVFANPQKEIGHFTVELTSHGLHDGLFEGFNRGFPVFQWHGETFRIPRGARKLASSRLCINQAFRRGNAYGLQFHLEVSAGMVEDWTHQYATELKQLRVDAEEIILEARRLEPTYRELTHKLMINLLQLVDVTRHERIRLRRIVSRRRQPPVA
ncbi:MAG: type 1 glutamine amidotransferase [Candidatus Bathyarchaeia archaeon]